MNKTAIGVSVLDRQEVSVKEIVEYLQSLDDANAQVILVLSKKPTYPGYKSLPWYIEVCRDKAITEKLKREEKLAREEKSRLKETLGNALLEVKKLNRWKRGKPETTGLEDYINAHLA